MRKWGLKSAQNDSPQALLSGKNPGKYIPQGCDGCGSRASAFCNPNRTLYITHWWSKNCTGQVFHSQQMRANGYTYAALTKELIRDYNYSRQSATMSCFSTKLGKSGFVVSSSCSSTPARSSDSCRTGSQGCISIAFHGKGCSANATESHNLAEGRCVRAMETSGLPGSNMLQVRCNKSSGTVTVLEFKGTNVCSGRNSSDTFPGGSTCTSNLPLKITGCGERNTHPFLSPQPAWRAAWSWVAVTTPR